MAQAGCSCARSIGPKTARRSPTNLWVIAILAFVWLVPPDWLADPMASGPNSLMSLLGMLGLSR
jgi:hypothetical protein